MSSPTPALHTRCHLFLVSFVTLDALKTSLPQESIEVVEEIKCTNAQLMDLASLKEAVKLHTLDLRCVVCMARARFTAHRPQL